MGLVFASVEATVEHLNIRRAKGDGDDIVAIDVKLTATLPAPVLAPALGATEQDIGAALWDEDGEPRLLGVEEVQTWGKFENHVTRFGRLPGKYSAVHKIKLKPQSGHMAQTTFTVTVEQPSRELVSALAEAIREEITVSVDSPPELPFDD